VNAKHCNKTSGGALQKGDVRACSGYNYGLFRNNNRESFAMAAERTRTRRNTLERRCLPKSLKRQFMGSSKWVFKLLEKVKKA
jgi:hypothetical protein